MATNIVTAALLLATLCYVHGVVLTDPLTLSSTSSNWAVTLTVEVARFSNAHMSFTSRQYCYQGACSIPGPTLKIKPGDTFNLTVINTLELDPAYYIHNTFHSPNATNVHTHGLHIDPNIDSVFIRIPPGGGQWTYYFKLPADHFPGTHWYHTHLHGNSALTVQGGLYGMILVDSLPAHNLPASITSAPTHQILLTGIKWNQAMVSGQVSQGCCFGCPCTVFQSPGCTDFVSSAPFAPFRAYSYPEIVNEIGDKLTASPVWIGDPTFTNVMYTNGIYQPTLTVGNGEPHYIHMLNPSSVYLVSIQMLPASACTMTVVAADGVYYSATMVRATLSLYPATRYDFMLTCTASATMQASYGESGDQWQATILTVTVSGSSSAVLPTNAEMAAIVRPHYLRDLSAIATIDPNARNEIHFSQGNRQLPQCGFWLGMGSNCSDVWHGVVQPSPTLPTCSFEQMPGDQGGTGEPSSPPTGHYKYVTSTGTVNEWQIYGLGADAHPFHLHVHHFQVVGFEKLATSVADYTPYYFIGEWRDTLPALDARVTIRFPAMDFPGETVLHCHVLRHEDLGMMSSVYVCDNSTTSPGTYGCPAKNQTAHVMDRYGYDTAGTYINSLSSSSSSGTINFGTGSSGGGGGQDVASSSGHGPPPPPPQPSTGTWSSGVFPPSSTGQTDAGASSGQAIVISSKAAANVRACIPLLVALVAMLAVVML